MLDNNKERYKVFNKSELGDLRAYIDENGEMWFFINDVAKILGVTNPGSITYRLRKSGFGASLGYVFTPRESCNQYKKFTCNRKETVVKRTILYWVCASSKKPNGIELAKWVSDKIVPALYDSMKDTILKVRELS